MHSAAPQPSFLAEPLLAAQIHAAKAEGLQQMRKLHFAQRTQLLCAAAASGSAVNLQFALALLKPSIFPEVLQRRRLSDSYTDEVEDAYIDEDDDVATFPDPGVAAVRAACPQLLAVLLRDCPGLVCRQAVLEEAAKCCDLQGLQAVWEILKGGHDNSNSSTDSSSESEDSYSSSYDDSPYLSQWVLDAAAESATPDAVAKMDWILEESNGNGCYTAPSTAAAAARTEDVDRLRWLRDERCCMNESVVLLSALQHAGLAVAQWLVDEAGCELPARGSSGDKKWYPLMEAAAKGQDGLAKLQWLEQRGAPPLRQADRDTEEAGDRVPADADDMHASQHHRNPQPQPQPEPVRPRPTPAAVTQFYGSNPPPPRRGSTSMFRSTSAPKPAPPSCTSKQQPTAPPVGLGAGAARGTAVFGVSGTRGSGVGVAAGKGLGEGPCATKSPSAVAPPASGTSSKIASSYKVTTGVALAAFGPQGMPSNHRARRAMALAAKGPGGVAPGTTGRSGAAPAAKGPGVGVEGGMAAAAKGPGGGAAAAQCPAGAAAAKGPGGVAPAAQGAGGMAAAAEAAGGVEAPSAQGAGGMAPAAKATGRLEAPAAKGPGGGPAAAQGPGGGAAAVQGLAGAAAAAQGPGGGAAAAQGPAGAAAAAVGIGKIVVTAMGMDVITSRRHQGPASGTTAIRSHLHCCWPIRRPEDDSVVLRLALAAANAGQVETVRHLLSVWGQDKVPESMARRFGDAAAASGSVPMAKYLWKAGAVFTDTAYTAAASQEEGASSGGGKGLDLEMVGWLAKKARVRVPGAWRLGEMIRDWAKEAGSGTASQDLLEAVRVVVKGGLLTFQRGWGDAKDLLDTAARYGDLALVLYLHGKLGCAPDGVTLKEAVKGGCEEVVEWLVRRYPACQDSSRPYAYAAKNGDLGTLTVLARLHVPRGRLDTVAKAVQMGCQLPALRWMVEHGARAGSPQGLVCAKDAAKRKPDVLALLQELEKEPDPECPVGSSQAAASGSRTKRRRSEWEDEYDCWSTDGGSGSEGDEGSDGDGDGEGGSDASWGSDGGYRDDSDDWGDDREDRWGDPYRSMPPHWYAGRGRSEDDERPRYHYCGGLDTGEPFDDPC